MNNQTQIQTQVIAQVWQGIVTALMVVWLAVWVFSQMKKAWKGEEVERPPLIPGK